MKVRFSKLDIGDLVLVRKRAFTGKHKIADCWEKDIYEISLRNDVIPVLTVKNLNGGKNGNYIIICCSFEPKYSK